MNILTDNIRSVYFKYLAASFGSTLISSIYGMVDIAMVGQYHGPDGSAALAVFAPIWNIIFSFGLLAGIGGSILFSTIRGEGRQDDRKSNEYFTSALILGSLLTLLACVVIVLFDRQLLLFFGANETLLPLAQSYLAPIRFSIPAFIFNQLLAAFLRNDNHPGLATAAILFGGIFNIFGDWFFVFVLDMGIFGAGLATAIGSILSLFLMFVHFFGKKNTLRLVRPRALLYQMKKILITGFPTCITDISMGILTILFNRQIMKYLGTHALAVYGIIVSVSTFVQCCAYSVGQAAQPIFSLNYGARQMQRIRDCLKYSVMTTTVLSLFWTLLSLWVPNAYIYFFMQPTQTVLEIAPAIIRIYSLSFLLLPLNVFSTFYFQALLQPKASFAISLARGCIISGALILLLPRITGPHSVWFSMLITEILVAVYAVFRMKKCHSMM